MINQDRYVRCVYCNELHMISIENGILPYENSVLRCRNIKKRKELECFCCGETRKYKFFKEELYDNIYQRCVECQRKGNVTRHEKYNVYLKSTEELFIDTIKNCNMGDFNGYLMKGINVNFCIQDRLNMKEKKMLGVKFREFDSKFKTHCYDRIWDRDGNSVDDTNKSSANTPLRILIETIVNEIDNNDKILNYFNMFKGLIVKGADTGDGWNYWLIKNEEMEEKNNPFFKAIGIMLFYSFSSR